MISANCPEFLAYFARRERSHKGGGIGRVRREAHVVFAQKHYHGHEGVALVTVHKGMVLTRASICDRR